MRDKDEKFLKEQMQTIADEICYEMPLFNPTRPRFYAWDKVGKRYIFMAEINDDDNYSTFLIILKIFFAWLGIERYIFASEAHMVVSEPKPGMNTGDVHQMLKDTMGKYGSPKEHPEIFGLNLSLLISA